MFIYGDFFSSVYTATMCLIKYKNHTNFDIVNIQNFNIYHFAAINISTLHFFCVQVLK